MDRPPPLLSVDGLSVEYVLGSRVSRVLDGLTFAAQDGELVLALGPSGCGKTTLLSVLAGLLRPTAGRVRFGDIEVADLVGRTLVDYRRRPVGVVFQAFNLVPSLTALENVMAPLLMTGVRDREARAVAMSWLDRMAMSPRRGNVPGSCPAVSSSASPSPGPWSMTRPSSWPTSRRLTSTPSRPRACWRSSTACTGRDGSSSWPPTTNASIRLPTRSWTWGAAPGPAPVRALVCR